MTNMESSTSYGPVKVSEEIDQVRNLKDAYIKKIFTF